MGRNRRSLIGVAMLSELAKILDGDEEFLSIENCEALRDALVRWENTVHAYWWYVQDNEKYIKLPEELLELWGAICMYGMDNNSKVEYLEDEEKLEALKAEVNKSVEEWVKSNNP